MKRDALWALLQLCLWPYAQFEYKRRNSDRSRGLPHRRLKVDRDLAAYSSSFHAGVINVELSIGSQG